MTDRPITGGDVVTALMSNGTKLPAATLTFGSTSGTVADGAALTTLAQTAAAISATATALAGQVATLQGGVTSIQAALPGYATNSTVTTTVANAVTGLVTTSALNSTVANLASTYVLQTALAGYPSFAQLTSALAPMVTQTALNTTLMGYPTFTQMTAAINTAKPPIVVDNTGFYVTLPDGKKLHWVAGTGTAAPVGDTIPAPGAPTTYTLASATTQIPGTFLSLDASLPSGTTALIDGTPGIQVDSSGDVLALIEPIQFNKATAGYGRTKLVAGGQAGFPRFVSTSSSYNNAYDALVMNPTLGKQCVGPDMATWGCIVAWKQTGPNSSAVVTFRSSGGSQVLLFGGGASDGALRFEQNNGSAIANEPTNALTTFGTFHIMTLLVNGSNAQIFRNATRTLQTPDGKIGGFGLPAVFEFLNNAQAEVSLIECFVGNPSIAEHQARLNLLATRFGISVGSVVDGSPTHIAAAPIDTTATFLTTPNFPVSDNLPTISGDVPGAGVTLAPGYTQKFSLIFGSGQAGANVLTGQQIRDMFYMNYMFGNQTDTLDPVGVTGQGDNPPFYARARHYAVGDTNDLHKVLSNGLNLRAIASKSGTDVSYGNIFGGMIRLPTEFRPGMTVEVVYTEPSNVRAWTPIWFISGVQKTPGAGGNPYSSGAIYFTRGGTAIEIDMNDMFGQTGSGIPKGKQLLFNSPLQNYGVPFATPPFFSYNASGGSGGYVYRGDASTPCLTSTVKDRTVGTTRMLMSWRTDKHVDLFEDGRFVQQLYLNYEDYADTYVENGVTKMMALHMIIGNQAVPTFEPTHDSVTTAEFTTNEHTLVVKSIKAWNGNVLNPDSYK